MRGFILLKPEAIQRNLVGEILKCIELKGFKITALKMLSATREQIQELYREHKEKSHYEVLINCCLDGPVVAILLDSPIGIDTPSLLKELQGKPDTLGTLRFYFSTHPSRGVLHCSSPGDVERESAIFFKESERIQYKKVLDEWIIARDNK